VETTTWDASFTLVNYSCILGYASGTGCNELVPEVGTVMETSADSKKRALGNYELLDLIGHDGVVKVINFEFDRRGVEKDISTKEWRWSYDYLAPDFLHEDPFFKSN